MTDVDLDICREIEQIAIDATWAARDAEAITAAQATDIVRLVTDQSLRPDEAVWCFDGLFAEAAEAPWTGLLRAWVCLTAQVRASAEMGWVNPRLWRDAW